LLGSLIVIVAVVILFISPFTKYLIEKYDIKYTGRQIKLDWAYVNPFTGNIYLKNLKVYELNSDSVFLSVGSVNAHFAVLKLFSKVYEITDLTLNHPLGKIIQTNKKLNFSDLIERSVPAKSDTSSLPLHFNLLNF